MKSKEMTSLSNIQLESTTDIRYLSIVGLIYHPDLVPGVKIDF